MTTLYKKILVSRRYENKLKAFMKASKQGSENSHRTCSSAPHSFRAKFQKPARNKIQNNWEIGGSYLRLQQFDIFQI